MCQEEKLDFLSTQTATKSQLHEAVQIGVTKGFVNQNLAHTPCGHVYLNTCRIKELKLTVVSFSPLDLPLRVAPTEILVPPVPPAEDTSVATPCRLSSSSSISLLPTGTPLRRQAVVIGRSTGRCQEEATSILINNSSSRRNSNNLGRLTTGTNLMSFVSIWLTSLTNSL